MSGPRRLRIALAAAVAASVGDLMMLWVANAARPELPLATPAWWVLPVGAALGVAAIPLYGVGYAALADWTGPARRGSAAAGSARGTGSAACAAAIRWGGIATGLLGGAIHGLTAWSIREALASGSASGPPLDAIVREGGPLLVAWFVEAVFFATASVALLRAGAGAGATLPRAMLAANPLLVTVVLGAVGALGEAGRSFLAPAAPNLAHVVLFAAALLAR